VVESLRLADGTLFPIPITLDVSEADIARLSLSPGRRIALRDPRDDGALAILNIEDIYKPDKVKEATNVLGADDPAHPSVTYLRTKVKDHYIGGKVQAIQPPMYFDYVALRCALYPLPPSYRQPIEFYTLESQIPLPNSAHISKNWHGAKSSPSRRATRCTVHIVN